LRITVLKEGKRTKEKGANAENERNKGNEITVRNEIKVLEISI
jgi:hypothetical protein